MDLANFLQDQILFYISIVLVLFLPGYFLLLAVFGKKCFSDLEKFVISFGLSIASVNFLLILLGKAGFLITKNSVLITIALFSAVCYGIYKFRQKASCPLSQFNLKSRIEKLKNCKLIENCKLKIVNLDSRTVLIVLLLFLTVFIKTAYLKNSIFPTSTDLGHHMYWSKVISETGQLPVYAKSKIIEINGHYQISQPRPIADFIIGEHLIFSAINLISGIGFISYFPSLILFLANIMGILAMFILVLRLFSNSNYKLQVANPKQIINLNDQNPKQIKQNLLKNSKLNHWKFIQNSKFKIQNSASGNLAQNTAILTLLFLGPLYAIASPQAKFVSGGVIGNILGNLFIPLTLYFYFRAFKEKNSWFLAAALFLTAALFYTHHLSSFIFIFVLIFALAIFLIFNIKNIPPHFKNWVKLIFSPPVILCLLLVACCLLLIYTPAYIQTGAVKTAVGEPSKATRAGLTFSQLKFSAGEARMALGILGIALLLWSRRRKTYAYSFLLGWLIALFAMVLKPQWLYLDIPSGRIANYISYPLAIVAAFAFVWIFSYAKNLKNKKYYIPPKLLLTAYSLLFTALVINGFYDNSQSLNAGDNSAKALQTFHASDYLADSISEEDIILKDHNYLTADTWMKLYFMRGYSFPFSRSYFKRYEDPTKKREQCTLQMISSPDSPDGKKCFMGTGVNFIMINPKFDSAQFKKSDEFWNVYAGDEIAVYYRNQ
ncbi:DUF1616 domain-containing protein [bacterium]|nr:DUF1616 domain-containing protein [bacterium]